MAPETTPIRWLGSTRERIDEIFDRLRIRPVSLVVLLASAVCLLLMTQHRSSRIHAPGIGSALPVEHSADILSEVPPSVSEVHVQIGDSVDAGDPLVTLSARFLERELALVDAEVALIGAAAQVEVGEIAAEEEERERELRTEAALARRDLALARAEATRRSQLASGATSQLDEVTGRVKSGVSPIDVLREAQRTAEDERSGAEQAAAVARAEASRHGDIQHAVKSLREQASLVERMRRAKEAEIGLLRVRRQGLLEDLEHLVVRARAAGRVKRVLSVGSVVTPEISVATLVPLEAAEIVAYVPPEKSVNGLTEGTAVHITSECSGDGEVLRVGSAVVEAPAQLATLLGRAFTAPLVYGTPVRVSIPSGCSYSVGQALTVELPEPRP